VISWAGWMLVPGITNAVWQQAFARDYSEVTTAHPPDATSQPWCAFGCEPHTHRPPPGRASLQPLGAIRASANTGYKPSQAVQSWGGQLADVCLCVIVWVCVGVCV
jgi:hypothetical protein